MVPADPDFEYDIFLQKNQKAPFDGYLVEDEQYRFYIETVQQNEKLDQCCSKVQTFEAKQEASGLSILEHVLIILVAAGAGYVYAKK